MKIKCIKCDEVSDLFTWEVGGKDPTLRACPNCWHWHTEKELTDRQSPPTVAESPKLSGAIRITYGASVTVPHPTKSFANSKPSLEVSAECQEADKDAALEALKAWVHTGIRAVIQQLHEMN